MLVAGVMLVQGEAAADAGDGFLASPYVVGAAMFGLIALALVVVYAMAALKKKDEP